MPIKAKNNFCFIKLSETETEVSGLIIPDAGQEKPHHGKLLDIGDNVLDKSLKKDKGKKAIFLKGNGFSVTYKAESFLVIEGEKIIGIDDEKPK